MTVGSLATFFDQGVLPFTGREQEGGEIVHFWEETFEAQWLRVALLLGEAGIGKSRLLAETLPRIVGKGGAVVHTKLYPGATTSPIPLIVQALGYSETARSLLRGEVEPTQASVAMALRRIARLRPTLLVVEDIHLLEGESLREFSGLLNAIADETISLLCVARPVELEARGPLERYLVREQRLAGLSHNDVAKLWQAAFASDASEELITPLCEATQGNPLALRSALRGALQSGTLMQNGDHASWHLMGPTAMFVTALRRNVSLLAEGMTSHLTAVELRAAETLATLGEVFSREAAAVMISDSNTTIERLMQAGILATNDGPVMTIYEAASAWTPLAFTHTLLHNHLAAYARVEANHLVDVVAEGYPLYSIHPLRLIVSSSQEITRPEETLRKVIDRADKGALALDTTPNWQLAMDVWHVAAALTEIVGRGISQKERTLLEAQLVHRKLGLLRRSQNSKECRELVERMMELTAEEDRDLVKYRFVGLRWRFWLEFPANPSVQEELLHEADRLIDRYADIDLSFYYVELLQIITQAALGAGNTLLLRSIEIRLNSYLKGVDEHSGVHEFADVSIRPTFFQLFDSQEELDKRLQMLRQLETRVQPTDALFLQHSIQLLESAGYMEEALKLSLQTLKNLARSGLDITLFNCTFIRECARAALGAELEDVEREIRQTRIQVAPPDLQNAGMYLSLVGVLRHDAAWLRTIVQRYISDEGYLSAAERIVLAVAENNLEGLVAAVPLDEEGELWDLARFAIDGSSDPSESLLQHLHRLLVHDILRTDDLLPIHAVATLVDSLRQSKAPFVTTLSPFIREALDRALVWLDVRHLVPYMEAIVEPYALFLRKNDLKRWRERIQELAKLYPYSRPRKSVSGRIALSMLGSIEATLFDGTKQRFQGGRMKKMLGALVGNMMLSSPLSRVEFNRLVAGDENDELARKNTNMGAVRLRDALGTEFLAMGKETHELDLALVEVDLLEANRFLREAAESLRRRSLMRGAREVLRVLEIVGDEVPFPGLYDTFFEALRDDFEQRLRSGVIRYGEALLREGDPDGARLLLEHAFKLLPNDEEIAELFRTALVTLGKRTEAERIRRLSVEALKNG